MKKLFVFFIAISFLVIHFFNYPEIHTIEAQTGGEQFVLYPVEDASVKSGSPSNNYGSETTLMASNYSSTNIIIAYLKFDLSNLSGRTVTSASLRFSPALARSVEKTVKAVSSNTWSQSTITWNNKPATGTVIGNLTSQSVTVGTPVNININTSSVQSAIGGIFSIAIDNTTSANTFEFYSKEAASGNPALIINTSSGSFTATPATTALQGDANGDGKVDGLDYVIWLNNYGRSVTGVANGDFNNDGRVDGLDYVIWLNNYGVSATVTPTRTSTPVPTTSATNTPTPRPSNTPSPAPLPTGSTSGCYRPYTATSPWNTRLTNPVYHPNSNNLINSLAGRTLGSNPDQFTYPVYEVRNSTANKSITVTGVYSNVTNNGNTLNRTNGTFQVPIPNGALQSYGDDAQMIIINLDTGDEWGFYEAFQRTDGSWQATNGYHYNINWSGVAPAGFGSRGAGVTYLAGLIRPCEIAQGRIDHAIAFAYNYPCSSGTCAARGEPYYVYPATKSDGKGVYQYDFPEGTKLQLVATDTEINNWCGSNNTCRIIAVALREYGMITIDNSGSAKIYPEANITANWGTTLTRTTPGNIPLSRFRVINY